MFVLKYEQTRNVAGLWFGGMFLTSLNVNVVGMLTEPSIIMPPVISYHHNQTTAVQITFQNSVNDLVSTIQELGNPFSYTSDALLVCYTKDVVDTKFATRLRDYTSKG